MELDEMTKQWMVDQFSTPKGSMDAEGSSATPKIHQYDEADRNLLPSNKDPYLSLLNSLDFSVWSFPDEELYNFLAVIFDDLGFITEFKIPIKTLFQFFRKVRSM